MSSRARELIIPSLYFLLILILFAVHFLIAISRPLWLDEIITLVVSQGASPFQLVKDFFNGSDTNPPLYFIVVTVLQSICSNNIFLLKVFSMITAFSGLLVLFFYFKTRVNRESLYLLLLLLTTSSFFSQFILFEIRPYALYFTLSTIIIVYYGKLIAVSKFDIRHVISFGVLSTLFLYTHYFSIIYIITLIIIELSVLSESKNKSVLAAMILALILYFPWSFAITNQLSAVHYRTWQLPRDMFQLMMLPVIYLGYLNLLILLMGLILLFIWGRFRLNDVKSFLGNKFNIVLIVFTVVPYIAYAISMILPFGIVERYFVPSFVSSVVLLLFILDRVFVTRRKLVISIILLSVAYSVYKLDKLSKINDVMVDEIQKKMQLCSEGLPVVCESPHKYFRFQYYAQKMGYSNYYLLLDEKSANDPNNIKNASFDYYWISSMKKYYPLKNIIEWNIFKTKHSEFIYIDEKDRMFDKEIKNQYPNSTFIHIGENVYRVKTHN